jgi:hypothetical protein
MTQMSSLITMQAAVSSVNWGLNVKPSLRKKSIDFFKSLTGKLTKIFLGMRPPLKLLVPRQYVEWEYANRQNAELIRTVAIREK